MMVLKHWKLSLIAIALAANTAALSDEVTEAFEVSQDPTKIDLPEKQGTIVGLAGSMSMSGNLGSSQYSYSLPNLKFFEIGLPLSLSYSSANGDGIVGQGWRITIPKLERTTRFGTITEQSPISDGERDLVSFQGYLRKSIEGEGDQSRYEIFDDRITKYLGNGLIYKFGGASATETTSQGVDYKWHLTEISDLFGNAVKIEYNLESGISYPAAVTYINQMGFVVYSISLEYEARSDVSLSYKFGSQQTMTKRLSKISAKTGDELGSQQIYTLSLGYGAETKRSLLSTINFEGSDASATRPKMSFQYSGLSDLSDLGFDATEDGSFGGILPSFAEGKYRIMDFNRDGVLDILAEDAASDLWYVWVNLGKNAFRPVKLNSDLQNTNLLRKGVELADIDGDQLSDLIYISDQNQVSYRKNLGLSEEGRVFGDRKALSSNVSYSPTGSFIDINGDSRVDYVSFTRDEARVYYNTSTDNEVGFAPAEAKEISGKLTVNGKWADINGDGLPDRYFAEEAGDRSDVFVGFRTCAPAA